MRHPDSTLASTEPPPSVHRSAETTNLQPAPKPKHTPKVTESDERPTPSTASTESPRTTNITPKAPSETKNVPSGTRTSKSTRVKSPYPPYNELDVSGLPSGSLAMDPTTQKVFRVP
jgi:hypothetical protein